VGGVLTATVVALSSVAMPVQAQAQGLRSTGGSYELEVRVGGTPAPTFSHRGESYVLGQPGERYTLRVWNRTGARIEAVVTVDGRDVIDGKPGDFRRKRGYMVNAWGFVDIDGWRLSERQAAAFRFTSLANSYAARMGNARNVGVIGVAVFPERVRLARPPRPIYPDHSRRAERGPADGARSVHAERRSEGKQAAPSASAAAPQEGAPMAPAAPAPQRPGLGTEFGESVTSHIREVQFVRANASAPSIILGLRYNDRPGLIALGIDVDAATVDADDAWLRGTADPFPVSQQRYATPPGGWRR
jgi:hypothetical protein